MPTTPIPPLEQAIARFYGNDQPDLAPEQYPRVTEQALYLFNRLVGLVAPSKVAAQAWGERHFINVFSSQPEVRQAVARLQGVAPQDVDAAVVRQMLGELGSVLWEGLAPGVSYPLEAPHAQARSQFRQALEAQLSGLRRTLPEHCRALLVSVVDDAVLRNQQRTWLQALRGEPSLVTALASRIALLPLLQAQMQQAFPTVPRLDDLAAFEQLDIDKVQSEASPVFSGTLLPRRQAGQQRTLPTPAGIDRAPLELPCSLATLILRGLKQPVAFPADGLYTLIDKRTGHTPDQWECSGAQLNALAAAVQGLGEADLATIDPGPVAEACRRRLQWLAGLAGAEGWLSAEELQMLSRVWTQRDAATLHDIGSVNPSGKRISVAVPCIETPDGKRHPLGGALVIGMQPKARVFLVAPHLGIEPFANVKSLEVELERRFNQPDSLQSWLDYLPAQERAEVGFRAPGANKQFSQFLYYGDVFERQAAGLLERLRSELAEVYRQTRRDEALGNLQELAARIDRLLKADTDWLAEAMARRTRMAIDHTDPVAILQASHLQAWPQVALPLADNPGPVPWALLFPAPPDPGQPEPVADDAYGPRLAQYFRSAAARKTAKGILAHLPDAYPAALFPDLAACLARRLWAAQAIAGGAGADEAAPLGQSRRYRVFHHLAALHRLRGTVSAEEKLLVANGLLAGDAPPDSTYGCNDWIDAQLLTRDWRRSLVHRHIGGGAMVPDVEALYSCLDGAAAFAYCGASAGDLANGVNPLLEAVLDSPAGQRLANALLKPAGWPADTDSERRQALLVAAVTDYLYPPDSHRAGYLCGFNLYDPNFGEHRWQQVTKALCKHLCEHFAGHSQQAVSLATVLLLRRHAPALLVRGIPDNLLYGHTQTAADFRHAVALAEATVPGLAWRMRFAELETLWKDTLEGATTEAQQLACAALRSDPSIYFALCRGRLKASGLDEVSDDQARQAIEFANEDAQRRERDLNVLLEPAPDRLEMARRQLLVDAPGLDQDRKVKMKETEKSRLNSVRIKYLESVNSLVRKPFTLVMSNLERYMTDVDGYGFTDEELGFDSKGAGGAALSRRFDEAYDRFEQAHRAALVRRLVDGIQDLPAIQREQLMAARRVVTVNFKDQEGGFAKVGHFGVLALGDGYAFELFCPSGTVRKVVLDSGPDVQFLRYGTPVPTHPGGALPMFQFTGLPRLDLSAYTEGRSGSATERAGKLQYLFSLIPRTVPPAQYVETLCKRLVDEHFGKVISQMRGFWRRETAYESYCRQSHEALDIPLGFIVPFYSLYLDIKNKQVGASTVVFGALELITFLLPLRAAFNSGYVASVNLGKVVAHTTSLGVSKLALRLAQGSAAASTFARVLVGGTLHALNPLPLGLMAWVGRAGWKGLNALTEALWRLRHVHAQLDISHVLTREIVRLTGLRRASQAPQRLPRFAVVTQAPVEAVARTFRPDFSWGNHRLSVAQQMQLHARDVDLTQAVFHDQRYRVGEAHYIAMQGNFYQVQRTLDGEWQIRRGEHDGPRVSFDPLRQQWCVVRAGLAGGMPQRLPVPGVSHRVTLPMDGVEGLAPDFYVRVAGQAIPVIYDVHEGGWRTHRGELLGPMVWRGGDGLWRQGTPQELRNQRGRQPMTGEQRTVEMPPVPAIALQLAPVPSMLHYIWVGPNPLERSALVNIASNANHASGYDSILHVDMDAAARRRLTAMAAELAPGLQVRDLNDEPFFLNLDGGLLGEQYRHILAAAEPHYPAASHVLRYPLLNAYGGIYLDVDVALLEDLQPGELYTSAGNLLLGSWIESPLGSGFAADHFASRADDPTLRAISAQMSQRYQQARAFYDNPAPRASSTAIMAYHREHARLTGAQLFNDVLSEMPGYQGRTQLDLALSLGVYDQAYERAIYRYSQQRFPFATLRMIQPIRIPGWQAELVRLAGPLSPPTLVARMQELDVPMEPTIALAVMRGQGRSDESITSALTLMSFEHARMREALDQWQVALSFSPLGLEAVQRQLCERLLDFWQANTWAIELEQPGLTLQLEGLSPARLPPLPPFFYPQVRGLRMGPQLIASTSNLYGRFVNLISLEVDCQGSVGGIIPAPRELPQLAYLTLRNLNHAARYLPAIRQLTTLRSLDLTGARGLTHSDNLILDLRGLTLHTIVLDRCRLAIFPEGDFSMTQRLSLAHNQIRAIPFEILVNPYADGHRTEVVLWGNPLPLAIQTRLLFAMGQDRRFQFIFDESRLTMTRRLEVDAWRMEALRIRNATHRWVDASGSAEGSAAVRRARERIGQAMQEAHRQHCSSGLGAPLILRDLTELPPADLPRATYLAVHHLDLRFPNLDDAQLCEFIRRFDELRSLSISDSVAPVGALMDQLPQLSHLNWLELRNVGLVVDQRVIDLLTNISGIIHIDLSSNLLGVIDSSQALAERFFADGGLILANMQMQELPSWIDANLLDSLEELDLSNNRLTHIPEDLFSNAQSSDLNTEVTLQGNPLDPALAQRLLDSVSGAQMQHNGPRFVFNLDAHPGDHAHAQQLPLLRAGVEPWLENIGEREVDNRRRIWQSLEQATDAANLLTMVDQLRQTADFRHSLRRTELINSVWTVLQQAQESAVLRRRLNDMAEEGARMRERGDTCSDGLRIEFARIETEVTTWQAVPPNVPPAERGAYLYRLLRSRYRADAVEIIANRQARGRDVAGVRMAYWIGTRESLELPVGPRTMAYPSSAQLHAGELPGVVAQVLEDERQGGLLDYTQLQPFWNDYLRERYAERFASLETEYRQQVLEIDDYHPSDSPAQREARLQEMVREYEAAQQTLIRELTDDEGQAVQAAAQ